MEPGNAKDLVISTKQFYSSKAKKGSQEKKDDDLQSAARCPGPAESSSRKVEAAAEEQLRAVEHTDRAPARSRARSKARLSFSGVKINSNKNVGHKIRREQCSERLGGSGGLAGTPVRLERIAKTLNNEKLRDILTTQRAIRKRIDAVYELCRISGNPIEQARPLKCLMESTRSNEINNNKELDHKRRRLLIERRGEVVAKGTRHSNSSQTDFDTRRVDKFHAYNADEKPTALDFSEDEMNSSVFSMDFSFNEEESVSGQTLTSNDTKKEVTQPETPTGSTKPLRKFFKSNRKQNTPKTITITHQIRANLNDNGQFSLNFNDNKFIKQRQREKRQNHSRNKFFQEQVIVNEIIENLNDSKYGDCLPSMENNGDNTVIKADQKSNDFTSMVTPSISVNSPVESFGNDPYYEYRQRIPFKTQSEEIQRRQELMLDFLIENDICNERNFTIFIGEPDKYRAEAEQIVELLIKNYASSSDDDEQYSTVCKENCKLDSLETVNDNDLRKAELSSASSNDDSRISYRRLFPIFDKQQITTTPTSTNPKPKRMNKYKPIEMLQNRPKRTLLLEANNSSRSSTDGHGRSLSRRLFGEGYDQYQIDAGQKSYGATECPQCGLLYTVHEPEEERLHTEYHSSVKILRFKGWLDEGTVRSHPEWGHDGRILCLNENSNARHLQRLKDILTQVVDKEMGYTIMSSTMGEFQLPSTFKAFLAVRKMQFVGLCLVEPLQKAYKYVHIDGVDCCTEEEYDALCGITRIWVAPRHRRLGIATKLMEAVRLHTIYGQQITFDKMAFSIPTEVGKLFAQKLTQTTNFLVYQTLTHNNSSDLLKSSLPNV